jgi:LytS/YehU family sensor histidine kinase
MAALAVFILIRYLNNLFWLKEYYISYGPNNNKYQQKFLEITMIEAFRGIQFIFIAFSYRLVLDRTIMEKNKRELEKAKLKSELATLRFQLNPHFLFNAFNSLYSMALKKSDSTADALLKLSDMFRYVLQQNEELVHISNEVEHIERLISFEKIRFPESCVILHVDIAPSQRNLMMPPLLLATFVENAFKHGDPGTEDSPISVRLIVTDKKLSYTVINNVSFSNPEGEHRDSFGLSNLRRRLDILFPDNFTLEYTQMENHFFAKMEVNLNS